MSDNLRQYVKAVYAFDHVLRSATAKSSAATVLKKKAPCAGWTGKDVYEHSVGNVAMIKSFAVKGKGPKSTPKVGDDPVGAWDKLRDTTLEALDRPGVLQSIAHEPFGADFGSMPLDNLVGFMAAELAVHTWDMARTAKVDERLDPALAKFSLGMWKSLSEDVLRSPGFCAAAIKPAAGADVQTKLLNFMGRAV